MNLNNNAQFFNNVTTNSSVGGKRQLREQRIDPKDLAEISLADLERNKKEGIPLNSLAPKKREVAVNAPPEQQEMNVAFAPPKKDFFNKNPVFLPDKDQKYNDIRSLTKQLPFQNLISKVPSYTQAPVYVQSQPQTIQYQPNTVQYQPQGISTQVKTKRIIHKLNGEIVEEEI